MSINIKRSAFNKSVERNKEFEEAFNDFFPSWKKNSKHCQHDFERMHENIIETVELKTDERFLDTGNVFLEVQYTEDQRPSGLWKASEDGVKLFVIQIGMMVPDEWNGGEQPVVFHHYIFDVKELVEWLTIHHKHYKLITIKYDFSVQGYAIPINDIKHLTLTNAVLE